MTGRAFHCRLERTMETDQLNDFLAVRKYRNFSVAADELFTTQSSLSKRIKALEAEFGVLLFDRKARIVETTSAGEEFASFAEHVLEEYQRTLNKMLERRALERGTLSVAVIPVLAQYGITGQIAQFHQEHPNIQLTMVERENDLIIEMMRNSEIDLAMMRTNFVPQGWVDVYPIPDTDDELVFVIPANHRLAQNSFVTVEEIDDESLILLTQTSGIYRTVFQLFESNGKLPNVVFLNSRIETIIGLIHAGMGASLLMRRAISYFRDDKLRMIPVEPAIHSELALVTSKHRKETDAVKALIAFMTQQRPHDV